MSTQEKNASKPENRFDPLQSVPLFGRDWSIKFDEPELSSDAGLAALVSSGIADPLLANLAGVIDDPRKSSTHSIEQLIRQRTF